MNPAFAILVATGLVMLWFLLSWLYKPLGKFIYRIGKDAVDAMTEEEMNDIEEGKKGDKEE